MHPRFAAIGFLFAALVAAVPVDADAQAVRAAAPAAGMTAQSDLIIRQLNAQVQASGDIERRIRTELTAAQQLVLIRLQQLMVENPASPEVQERWQALVNSDLKGLDINALVQWVMREAYLQQVDDLRSLAERVKFINHQKQALRDELGRLDAHPCRAEPCPPFQTNARDLQTSFGSAFLTSPRDLAAYRAELEGQLQTVGADAQLANVDLQNVLQRQQQALQMISNISKMMHDTAMSVIRKIGG